MGTAALVKKEGEEERESMLLVGCGGDDSAMLDVRYTRQSRGLCRL